MADIQTSLPGTNAGSWILGLDLGTDSIGWASFDAAGTPLAAMRLRDGGVRLFDSGRDEKKQTSRHADRGMHRRTRRQPRQRRWRKRQLAEALAAAGLGAPNVVDPALCWRARAAAPERDLEPAELWAALAHLANHRGFRSTRFEADAARAAQASRKAKPKAKETEPDAEDDPAGFWQSREDDLRGRMAAGGFATVGQMLATELHAGHPVRMRYATGTAPTRALLQEEFAVLRERQGARFPHLDWQAVEDLIFDQRPLRSVDSGHCEIYPEEPRCPRMLPSAQDFLVRQTLANLRVPEGRYAEPRLLTPQEWEAGYAALSASTRLEWPKLRAAMGLTRRKFTIEIPAAGGKKASRATDGNATEAVLGPLIPGWDRMTLPQRDGLVEDLLAQRQHRRKLVALLVDPAGPIAVERETAEAVADAIQFALPTGRLSLSRRAVREIGAAMGPGIRAHEAFEAATGRSHSDRRPTEKLDRLPYYGAVLRGGLVPVVNRRNPEEQEHGRIANISVHIALNETRKIVNALIERYGRRPSLVVVETTRELKSSTDDRIRMMREQGKREKENEAIDKEIAQLAPESRIADKREARLRWRLAQRQNNLCPYTGEEIGKADILTDLYQLDHVVPLSRGGRDVFGNMVLCRREANQRKRGRTPWQAFQDDPQVLRHIDDYLARLPEAERRAVAWRFGPKADLTPHGPEDEEAWAPRQIRDTSYTARRAMEYLLHVADDVFPTQGALTSFLRQAWDLPKRRYDHRSHFVDAAVIAVTGRSQVNLFNRLAARNARPDPRAPEIDVPEPYTGFRFQVLKTFAHLWPSPRPRHPHPDDTGDLHEATLYGLRPAALPDGGEGWMVVTRKPVADLFKDDKTAEKTLAAFASDRMAARFSAVLHRLREAEPTLGLAEACRKAVADPLWGPRGMTGNTVRLLDKPSEDPGLRRIPRGDHRAAVKTGSNALYRVWETRDAKGRLKWHARVVTRFDAATADTTGGPLPPPADLPPDAHLVMQLRRGDLLYLPTVEGDRVFWVKQMVTDGRLRLWPLRYATGTNAFDRIQSHFPTLKLDPDKGHMLSSADALRKLEAKPATVSCLGRLRVKRLD